MRRKREATPKFSNTVKVYHPHVRGVIHEMSCAQYIGLLVGLYDKAKPIVGDDTIEQWLYHARICHRCREDWRQKKVKWKLQEMKQKMLGKGESR